MFKVIESNEHNNKLKELAKSTSNVAGVTLREAHYLMGKEIANAILETHTDEFFSVLIVMRSGLFLALGIADQLDLKGRLSNISFDYEKKQGTFPTIIVDAVIHSGKTIIDIVSKLPSKTIIATSVISSKAVAKFNNANLFTMRVSENYYKGSSETKVINGKGPDTGDRLFDSLFYKK